MKNNYLIGTTYEGGRSEYLRTILPFVDYLEISPDSISTKKGKILPNISPKNIDELKLINEEKKILIHGVGLSIGSYDGYSKEYIKLLDELFENLRIEWHSEHLAYTKVNGITLGTMLTLPRNNETLEIICKRVDEIQKRYKVPFLLENVISMLPFYDNTYSDADFLNRIANSTGCGLILDLYNLECDANNFGLNIDVFLGELDFSNIYEIHVAGGITEDNFMMDIHARPCEIHTLNLMEKIINQEPPRLKAITYEILDEFVELVGTNQIINEIIQIDNICNKNHDISPITNQSAFFN